MLEQENATVVEAAKVWKARRLNRDPAGFYPELYTKACNELDQAVTALIDAERVARTAPAS